MSINDTDIDQLLLNYRNIYKKISFSIIFEKAEYS